MLVVCKDGSFEAEDALIKRCHFFNSQIVDGQVVIKHPYCWNNVKEIKEIYSYLSQENKIRILCRDGSFESTKEIFNERLFPGLIIPASLGVSANHLWVTLDCLDSFIETPYPWHNVKSMKLLIDLLTNKLEEATLEELSNFFIRKDLEDVLLKLRRYRVFYEHELQSCMHEIYHTIQNQLALNPEKVMFKHIKSLSPEFYKLLNSYVSNREHQKLIFKTLVRNCSPLLRFIKNTYNFFDSRTTKYMKNYFAEEIDNAYETVAEFSETEEFLFDLTQVISNEGPQSIEMYIEDANVIYTIWDMYRIPLLGYIFNRDVYVSSNGARIPMFGKLIEQHKLDAFDTVPPKEFLNLF